jgi:SAM-dependent methyltransferase
MTLQHPIETIPLPGSELDTARMPGHWLLARLGKKVLRPGGLGVTDRLLESLAIGPCDDVVEFAPGLGVTARRILTEQPREYTGIERDPKAARWTERQLPKQPNISIIDTPADRTGLADRSATVVIGEAMLSMNPHEHKRRIVAEAFRILRPGGRYGIHELCVVPDEMQLDQKREIDNSLSSAIHVGARPLPQREWRMLLEEAGFRVIDVGHAPMHLLRPRRLIEDEGLWGALRIAGNILRDRAARQRVLAMRRVFECYRRNLDAIFIVAQK